MCEIILDLFEEFRAWVSFRRYLVKLWFKRLRRAWQYINDSMSGRDAQEMIFDCQDQAGQHSLLVLNTAAVLDDALEIFVSHPDLPRLVRLACAHVGRKWEANGDEYYEAVRWALKTTERYATDFGVALIRLDGEAAAPCHDEGDEE